MDASLLENLLHNSERSVSAWNTVIPYLKTKQIPPELLFDNITYLITSRCKAETSQLYNLMAEQFEEEADANTGEIPVFWLGYPLWYHDDRYLSEELKEFRVAGSNYIIWWSLDYAGDNVYEKLFSAYNYTFLNLSQRSRNERLSNTIQESGAVCAVTLHNKSCKCDFVSARNINIPQVELEIDMIDRTFLNKEKARAQLELLKETVCTG
jgi:hypothetical protein